MKHQTNPEILTQHRPRSLRNNATDAERAIWQHLRGRQMGGARFRRQHALGNYVVDFASFDAMLIVELDGGQHAAQIEYDALRDAYLASAGFKVLRFWNNDVMQNPEGVLETIRLEVTSRTLTPSPP
ncbi:MAG: DUF559 domain-containing protein [Betaproteobacteria bacterium]|nr:DUF559 domain-containing protein [Betaproteobacteria bacterium]